jgi:predicted transcriptional regulator
MKHARSGSHVAAQVAAMRAKNMPWAAIAHAMGMSEATARKWLARHAEIQAGSTTYDVSPRIRSAISLLEKHGYTVSPPK